MWDTRHGSLFPRSDGCYSLAVPRVADQRSGVDFSLTEDGKQRNEWHHDPEIWWNMQQEEKNAKSSRHENDWRSFFWEMFVGWHCQHPWNHVTSLSFLLCTTSGGASRLQPGLCGRAQVVWDWVLIFAAVGTCAVASCTRWMFSSIKARICIYIRLYNIIRYRNM